MMAVVEVTTVACGAAFLVWIVWAFVVVIRGEPLLFDLNSRCDTIGPQCGVLFGFGTSLLTIALATAVFVVVRLWLGIRPIKRKAQTNARDYVPTAVNSIMDEVVGRDELCYVITQELEDRDARRPHLLVGGVGAGKTAVVVHLTKLLAERGAVVVPVRLRDVGNGDLDFSELARQRFCREVDEASLKKGPSAGAIGVQAWRWLRKEDRVVVLADGLEEVFAEREKEKDRDNLIRRAIREAGDEKLPLVVASRPHAPLKDVDAAITELEPLSEEAALAYIGEGRPGEDERRLDWVVERADVSEAPLYLQVAKQLYQHDLLEYVVGRSDGGRVDTRDVDRAGLRCRLLMTWTDALINGHLREEVALPRQDRRAAVEQISTLACIGLQQDSVEVKFEDLDSRYDKQTGKPDYPHLEAALEARLATIYGKDVGTRPSQTQHLINLPLAATWAEQLGLVEAHGDRVRFQHSIMQAYLGSRFMEVALDRAVAPNPGAEEETGFLAEALRRPRPSREFLMSLVFRSRDMDVRRPHIDELVAEAEQRLDEKSLDLFATALEIDRACGRTDYPRIVDTIVTNWPAIQSQDRQGLTDAKLNLVHRLGDILRDLAKRAARDSPGPGPTTPNAVPYRQFFEIACQEPSYAVRLAIAEEIGCGGDTAFDTLAPELANWTTTGGAGDETNEGEWRRIMGAWLTPMLVGSVSDDNTRRKAKRQLVDTLKHARPGATEHREHPLSLALEVALSQGFMAAANRRKRHFATCPEAEVILLEQGEELLKCARFWFSQLTLIQALTLGALPDSTQPRSAERANAEARLQHASPRKRVNHWLSIAGKDNEVARTGLPEQRAAPERQAHGHLHPFVREAAELAVLALETGRPERYLWIDETGVVNKVGSRPTDPTQPRVHNLWIPPSTGWTALDRRAQQLVADVLLLLNLAERRGPDERERYLQRANRPDLPPCLIGDRSSMRPSLSIARPGTSDPGSSCADGCPFELCPYPPRGTPQRQEFGEAFCRGQQTLLRTWRSPGRFGRSSAPWQRGRLRDLREFWRTMANRQRVPRPEEGAG
jgi:hypothetical protein